MTNKRKIGVEIEFAGIPIEEVATLTSKVFGGSVRENHALEFFVDSELGEFRVELDSKPLKDLAERAGSKKGSGSFTLARLAIETVRSAARTLVPCEIVAPPLPEAAFSRLDELVAELRASGASGTHDGLLYAFGVHFNPELNDLRAEVIHVHLQSFFLLRPWIKDAFNTDLSRQVTPYIRPHDDAYVALVLGQEPPTMERLIDEYVRFNPTRNRDLDMLPMLTYLDEERVRKVIDADEKVNKRPTFHYRLPNAELSDPDWSISKEWRSWQAVEDLASNPELLGRARAEWNRRYGTSTRVDETSWIQYTAENLV